MRPHELPPDSLVATAETIRGAHYRPEHRQPLVDAGFDWTSFEHRLGDLQAAGVGFARGCFPIRLQLDDAGKRDKIAALLDGLCRDLAALRELGPRVFGDVDTIDSRIKCTAPDGTPHTELAKLDSRRAFIIALQDCNEFVHDELPHLSRMTSAWAIYLFGNYLDDRALQVVNFRRFQDLRLLNLAENNLSRLPAGVVDCARLELLSLARNPNLRALPDDIGRLRSLRLLDLSGTNLGAQAIRQVNAALPNCRVRV